MDEAEFTALHTALAEEVYAYAARRSAHHTADDVVSETFAALWAQRDRIPGDPDGRRAWVIAVARHHLQKAQYAEARRQRLGARLWAALQGGAVFHSGDVAVDVVTTDAARRAWRMLDPRDQEVLALTAWEGLGPQEVATVLGITVTAVTSRLHRARRHLHALQVAAREQP